MATAPSDRIRLLRYDVFTDRPFAGNPLAVAIEPPPLTDDQMLQLARELNLSETVFLSRADDDGWRTRIFTPATELPFAGHPTVGAALALAEAGEVTAGRVVLQEGVGPVEVQVEGGVATLTTPGPPRHVDVADPDDVVAAVGLELDDLHPELGPRGWSAGLPYTVLAVRDLAVLGRARMDPSAWRDGVGRSAAPDLYLLAPLDGVRGQRWRARMFGPVVGFAEDPATGSAAAAACGYLAGAAGEGRLDAGWIIEQGVEMGRPSEIRVQAVRRGAELLGARIGGRAARVGSCELLVPAT